MCIFQSQPIFVLSWFPWPRQTRCHAIPPFPFVPSWCFLHSMLSPCSSSVSLLVHWRLRRLWHKGQRNNTAATLLSPGGDEGRGSLSSLTCCQTILRSRLMYAELFLYLAGRNPVLECSSHLFRCMRSANERDRSFLKRAAPSQLTKSAARALQRLHQRHGSTAPAPPVVGCVCPMWHVQ